LQKINDDVELESFHIDAMNIDNLGKCLKDASLVINSASPICNIPIMKSCLNSNTHYMDLASDPFNYPDIKGTSLDDQIKLHNEFLKKDLLAVTNTGFSPGFTDILCKHVITENSLDRLDYFKVYMVEKILSDKLVSSWSPYILLLETINQPTVYDKGKIVTVDHNKLSKIINFSDNIGEIKVMPVNGHPELRTIPDFINIPIKYLEIAGGFLINDLSINDIIVELLRKKVKVSSYFEGDIFQILASSFDNQENFIHNYKNGVIKNEFISCLFEIKGKSNGKIIEYKAIIEHDLKDVIQNFLSGNVASFIVSLVPSIIAEKILYNEINERGVIAPAALSSASEILKECKERGLNFKELKY
jgi:saccharopine dehydrogenase-like NADP-dependent oxidoreductase